MLTQATIQHAIATSIDIIQHRLQIVPISAEAIARVYGVDADTADQLGKGRPFAVDRDAEMASITCTFSCSTTIAAQLKIAEMVNDVTRIKFYTPFGVLGYRSIDGQQVDVRPDSLTPHPVLHVEFPIRCSAERLHELANQPFITSIVSIDGQNAFK